MRIGAKSFDTGAASGGQTITLTYDPIDLSCYSRMLGELKVTTADTDAGDTLDSVIQFTRDGSVWNSVAAWDQILGSMSPTEIRHVVLQQPTSEMASTEQAYEPTGSGGATALVAGSVRNSPFPGKIYLNNLWIAAFRVVLTVVDANSNARFAGSVTLWLS